MTFSLVGFDENWENAETVNARSSRDPITRYIDIERHQQGRHCPKPLTT